MKRFNILLVVLEGCSVCKNVKELIDSSVPLKYSIVSCEKDCRVCDEVEELTKSIKYPMIIVKDSINNLNYIIYQTKQFSELGTTKKVSDVILVPSFGEKNLVTNLNNILNK